MTNTTASGLDEFLADAAVWLDDHAGRPDADREYGDEVGFFSKLSVAEERRGLAEAREWERSKSDAGYGSISWPRQYGGAGLPRSFDDGFRRLERQFVTPSGHELLGISMNIVAPAILALGTDEQRLLFLPALNRAERLCCQLFSEPGAGSDLSAISTWAEPDGDHWRITGQKVWTSGAQFADYGMAICRSDRKAAKQQALTAFIIEMNSPGVEVRPLRQMSGGSSFNEVFLTDVRVPDANRLGPVGTGWNTALTTLGFERKAAIGGGSAGPNRFTRLLELARELGRDNDPLIRQRLASIYIGSRVRSVTRRRMSATSSPGPEMLIGKLAWTKSLEEITELATELLSSRLVADTGEPGTYCWADFVLTVPGLRLGGGTDEIQRNAISERGLGLPKDPFRIP